MTIQTEVRPAVEPKVKTTGDVLRHAALIIEERGWCQNRMSDSQGRVCAMGAILTAGAGNTRTNFPAFQSAMDRLDWLVGDSTPSWNDAPGRTAAEVTAALRAAADKADRV